MYQWRPYVPAAQRRANAHKKTKELEKKGKVISPVQIEGRKIAQTFWGMRWCEHLESFSDYANRLPRGKTYVRNGSVCHLEISAGRIEAMVSGSDMYNISIQISTLSQSTWESIKRKCSGQIGSILELLQGRLSSQIMEIVSHRDHGLFPKPREIEMRCSCPDWAVMCKHVAAVMYGVGNRLDTQPELLFLLRGVDPSELIDSPISLPSISPTTHTLNNEQLGDIFGIELDTSSLVAPPAPPSSHEISEASPQKRKRGRPPKTASHAPHDPPPQEATAKKAATKQPTTKKATTKKVTTKKAATKQPTTKKAAVAKKATTKKVATKKVTTKKAAVAEKTSAKPSSGKKAVNQRSTTKTAKKTTVAKTTAKKTTAKKMTRKKVTTGKRR